VINTDPNTSILGSDWIADRATVLAAKSVYARAFGILFGGHPPKMFVDALRYTRAPKYAILAAILLVPLLVLVGQQTTPVDDPIQMYIDEIQPRCRAPVP
jgi:hypothetical protein